MSKPDCPWPFLDPPNTAVFTDVRILDLEEWVQYVTHDEEDGTWQFHCSQGPASMNEAAVVGLKRMVEIEPRLAELADPPLGWHAAREQGSAVDERAETRK